MSHSHHNHHDHSHHNMEMTTENSSMFDTGPATTAATLLQAVMTTVMTHSMHGHHHHNHDTPMDSPHAGHTMDVDFVPRVSSHLADVHSNHITAGDHMQMYFHFGVDTIILFKEWTTSTTEDLRMIYEIPHKRKFFHLLAATDDCRFWVGSYATSIDGLIGSIIGIFIMAMLYEGIKFFREFLFKKYFTSLEYSSVSVLGDDGKPVTEVHKVARNRMLSWPHILQTFLHIIQMVMSYFLMLIFMTYNVWLCLAVIAGSGMGYFLFGWRKATVVDITEHCH